MLTLKVLLLTIAAATALDLNWDTTDLVKNRGFSAEFLTTYSSGGYFQNLLFAKPLESCSELKNPVLFVHGLFCTSDIWFLQDISTGFKVLDDCRPTFATNERGNSYCQKHKTLSTLSPLFWRYGLEQTANDLIANIALIEQQYPGRLIDLICHSKGCNEALLMLAKNPTVKQKLGKIIFLAPAIFMHDTKAAVVKALAWTSNATPAVEINMEALHSSFLTAAFGQTVCDFFAEACLFFLKTNTGSSENINEAVLPQYFTRQPGGSSVTLIRHLIQGVVNEETDFSAYNYGTLKNLMVYGSSLPPKYNASQMDKKVNIFYGGNDTLVVKEDVERSSGLLSNVEFFYSPENAHNDYFLGDNLDVFVNPQIMSILNSP